MSYTCMECGEIFEYEHLLANKLKCTKCKEKRSNIWYKSRPPITKTVIAR